MDYTQQLAALPSLGVHTWGGHQPALHGMLLPDSAQAQLLAARGLAMNPGDSALLADSMAGAGRGRGGRRSLGLSASDVETRARLIESFRQAAQQQAHPQHSCFGARQVQVKDELSLAAPGILGAASGGGAAASHLRQYQQLEQGAHGAGPGGAPTNGMQRDAVSPELLQLALQQMLSRLRPEQVLDPQVSPKVILVLTRNCCIDASLSLNVVPYFCHRTDCNCACPNSGASGAGRSGTAAAADGRWLATPGVAGQARRDVHAGPAHCDRAGPILPAVRQDAPHPGLPTRPSAAGWRCSTVQVLSHVRHLSTTLLPVTHPVPLLYDPHPHTTHATAHHEASMSLAPRRCGTCSAGMLTAVGPAAMKYCGSCYETKPVAEFAVNGAGDYCRCASQGFSNRRRSGTKCP